MLISDYSAYVVTDSALCQQDLKRVFKRSIPSLSSWSGDPWAEEFITRFTNSRCAGYKLSLDTYLDNLTNLGAAKPGFPLVKSCKKLLGPLQSRQLIKVKEVESIFLSKN